MPEKISVFLDLAHDGALYDALLARIRTLGTKDLGDLTFVTKAHGTVQGRPIVLLTFTAVIEGKPVLVHSTTTLRVLRQAISMMDEAHPREADGPVKL